MLIDNQNVARFEQELNEAFQTEILDLTNHLANGGAVDWADYKRLVGSILTLHKARATARELRNKFLQEESELDE